MSTHRYNLLLKNSKDVLLKSDFLAMQIVINPAETMATEKTVHVLAIVVIRASHAIRSLHDLNIKQRSGV